MSRRTWRPAFFFEVRGFDLGVSEEVVLELSFLVLVGFGEIQGLRMDPAFQKRLLYLIDGDIAGNDDDLRRKGRRAMGGAESAPVAPRKAQYTCSNTPISTRWEGRYAKELGISKRALLREEGGKRGRKARRVGLCELTFLDSSISPKGRLFEDEEGVGDLIILQESIDEGEEEREKNRWERFSEYEAESRRWRTEGKEGGEG